MPTGNNADKPTPARAILERWLPPFAWMALIFVVSAQPTLPRAPQPWVDTLLKKFGHAFSYGLLAWLFLRALRGREEAAAWQRLISALLATAYGASDELHQSFVPGRNASMLDVLIDGTGATLGMFAQWLLARARSAR